MRRACILVILAWGVILAGCGGTTRTQGMFPPGSTVVRTSGFVSFLQFTSIRDLNGAVIDVTLVTLVNNEAAIDLTFCGDAIRFFPVNDFVEVTFVPATPCISVFSSTF